MIHFSKAFAQIFFLMVILLWAGCANVVAPTGGPIDEDPPVVVRSTPSNYSTHYKGQDVRIWFDEFVELKNLRQNFLVSPPLENDPEVRIRGRSIIMQIEDTLAKNTTYNFFFGESIVDITEGNAIPNFQFVVSTGSYLDSLSVRGKVLNSLTHKPEEGIFVMLYDDVFDSVPMLKRPVYLSKTNKEGEFMITNMRQGEYLMFALKDMNANYLYDTPDEKIAFLDSLITPEFAGHIQQHVGQEEPEGEAEVERPGAEANGNGLIAPNDTLPGDTLLAPPAADIKNYTLYLFQEKDTVQRLVSAVPERKGKINLAFRSPVDSVTIRSYTDPLPEDWYIREYSKNRDTLGLWFAQAPSDTLYLEVSDRGVVLDSVVVSTTPRPARGRGAPREEDTPTLNITAPDISARKHPFFKNFTLRSQTPLAGFEADSLSLLVNDSVPVATDFRISGQASRTLVMLKELEPDTAYRLVAMPGALTDIFGAVNDTLTWSFKATTSADYGSFLVNLTISPDDNVPQYILQLLDDKWDVKEYKIIEDSGTYRFDYLAAGNYRLRLVYDTNANGIWDTGNYLKGIQPERVSVYHEQVQARLNWEVELIWGILPE